MKIIYVATFIPETNYTRDLSVYLNTLLGRKDKLFLCGCKSEEVNDGKIPVVDRVWTRNSIKYLIDVIRYIEKIDPDVIHLQHEFKMYGGLSTALVYPLLLLYLRLKGYPIVVTIHGVVAKDQVDFKFLKNFNVIPNNLFKYLVIIFFSYIYISIIILADEITVHAPPLKKVLKSYLGLANKKVVVIDHGVRELKLSGKKSKSMILRKFPILKKKNIIMVFGLFSPRKGYEFLINSFSDVISKYKMNNWVLALVGDVKDEFLVYKKKIINLIHRKNLKNKILITGFVNGDEIDEFFRNSDIIVIPAIISFNTSGALSLALAYKKPILVANVKPLAEEVESNSFGLLYDKAGSASLENQLIKLICNRSFYNKLIRRLSDNVTSRYWTNIAGIHLDLYREMTSHKKTEG